MFWLLLFLGTTVGARGLQRSSRTVAGRFYSGSRTVPVRFLARFLCHTVCVAHGVCDLMIGFRYHTRYTVRQGPPERMKMLCCRALGGSLVLRSTCLHLAWIATTPLCIGGEWATCSRIEDANLKCFFACGWVRTRVIEHTSKTLNPNNLWT